MAKKLATKTIPVTVPEPVKPAQAVTGPTAHYDRNRITCLEVSRTANVVSYLILEAGLGVDFKRTALEVFDERFKPIPGYPLSQAIMHFTEFAERLGATDLAAEALNSLNPTRKEPIMATTKKDASPAKKAPIPVKKSNASKPPAKKMEAKKPAAKPIATKSAAPVKKESAAQMFQDLIMEGKLTDDKIFEKVQTKFGLDDSKKGYVKWYRNHLAKLGKNPPAAK